jgi:4'-phosphopantetheinyl transferase
VAVCAIAPSCGALGCDLEAIEPRSDAFIHDYFTDEERALVEQAVEDDRPLLCTLLWSAKESALKALREGLRLDTRSVIATPVVALRSQAQAGRDLAQTEGAHAVNGWWPLRVRRVHGESFRGWWQNTRTMVRTMVAAPVAAPPVPLGTVGSRQL